MRELREAIGAGTFAEHGERVLAGVSPHDLVLARRALRAAPRPRRRRRGGGLRDRRRGRRPRVRAAAGAARDRHARARARHGGRRRQRPQRRVPARGNGRVLPRRPRALRPRAGARHLRTDARGPAGDLRAGRRAGRRRCRAPHRAAAGVGVRGGGRARAASGRGAARGRVSGRAGGARLSCRSRCGPASTTPASPSTTARCTRRAGSERWRAPPSRRAHASTSTQRSVGRSTAPRS